MSLKINEASWKFVGLQKTVILNRYTGFLVDRKSPHMSKIQFGFWQCSWWQIEKHSCVV
ncbi:hypothetical protein Hanom_Chr12g01106991 [Helianthus anomalus]